MAPRELATGTAMRITVTLLQALTGPTCVFVCGLCVQVIGISRNEELAWQTVEDLREEFPGAAISYKVKKR